MLGRLVRHPIGLIAGLSAFVSVIAVSGAVAVGSEQSELHHHADAGHQPAATTTKAVQRFLVTNQNLGAYRGSSGKGAGDADNGHASEDEQGDTDVPGTVDDPGHDHSSPEPSPSGTAPSPPDPHHHLGPWIDVSAIPAGSAGTSERRVGSTTQIPQPADDGAFRTVCAYSHMNFDDPIVFPGQPGATHLHTYFGNTAVDAFTTASSLTSTGNSTCRGGIVNRSSYWIPSLIDANGIPLAPKESHFYYKSGWESGVPSTTSPFPAGLRVLAGASMTDPATSHPRVYWSCHSEAYNKHDGIPTCQPGGELAAVVAFPMCWVGNDSQGRPILDSPDHRSHMAYIGHSTRCPSSHPIRLPEVTFNILWDIPAAGTSGWRLSSDIYDPSLPGGLSLHADWFVGWEEAIIEEFVTNCVNASVDCHSHLLGPGRQHY